ncbi:MAG: hypothetical protein HOE90_21780 [Bacteriovoracaceae bacterium]|nr:hypothetical protein [Bacteriovoracaceae bacterium]
MTRLTIKSDSMAVSSAGGSVVYVKNQSTGSIKSFALNTTGGSFSLNLESGEYDIAALAWTAGAGESYFEGTVNCQIKSFTLEGLDISVDLSLSSSGCNSTDLSSSEFLSGGTLTPLRVSSCRQGMSGAFNTPSFCDINTGVFYRSFEVSLEMSDSSDLTSQCFQTNSSNSSTDTPIKIPVGNTGSGFKYPVNIHLYKDGSCSNLIRTKSLDTGLISLLDNPSISNPGELIVESVNNGSYLTTNLFLKDGGVSYPCDGNAPFEIGSGLTSDPYGICTLAQLNSITNNGTYLTKSFFLMSDLDLTGQTLIPIGGTGGAPSSFTGQFNGGGFTISNLILDNGGNNFGGIFRKLGDGGEIAFLNITNSSLTNITSSTQNGVLVGEAALTSSAGIQNIILYNVTIPNNGGESGFVMGKISGSGTLTISEIDITGSNVSTVSNNFTGGIAGRMDITGGIVTITGVTISSTTVDASSYSGGIIGDMSLSGGTVTMSSLSVGGTVVGAGTGGIIGNAYSAGGGSISISGCSSTANVGEAGSINVGGLVGSINFAGTFNMADCYSTGSVTASSAKGQAVGDIAAIGSGGFTRILATGAVGTFVGSYTSGAVSASYFLDTGCAVAYGSGGCPDSNVGGAMGLASSELKTGAVYTGASWDLSSVWTIDENVSYPTLR